MTFQLDTTGYVQCPAPDQKSNESTGCWFWSDLSPFTQGYIEAAFAGLRHEFEDGTVVEGHLSRFRDGSTYWYPVGFSDLAPETLARIIADCEAVESGLFKRADQGRDFWNARQNNQASLAFPPLTVQLGDDGKVRFAQ